MLLTTGQIPTLMAAPQAQPPQETAILAPEAATHAGDTPLYLETTVNRSGDKRLLPFVLRGGRILAPADTLRQLGFRPPQGEAGRPVALDDLDGVAARYDAAMQTLDLEVPLALLSLPTTHVGRATEQAPAAQSSPGALLNYNLYGSHQDGSDNLTASSELRLFGVGGGVFSNTSVTRAYRLHDAAGWRGQSVRLDSHWQLSFPDSAVSLTVGDTYSGFLGWTRAVRLGGLQIGRNFGLQPYRVTTPLPAFLGEAAVPSSIDLYVNGMRQYSGDVPAGPFQLSTVPGINGAGNAQIVVTDAYGRTQTLDFPFYASERLLAKGLSDWSVSFGAVREDYGVRSFSYAGDPVGSGDLRYGASDRFTLEAHAEGGAGLANAGAGAYWLLGRAGVLGLSYARSALHGSQGGQTAAAYDWNDGRFNLSLQTQRTHGDYRDIASLYGSPAARVSDRALAGIVLRGLGNISASYVRLDYPGSAGSRYAGLFWNRTFSSRWSANLSANLSANQNLDRHDDRSLYLGISIALDGQRQASLSWQRSNGRGDATLDVIQPVPGDGDAGGFGWRMQARGGDNGGGGLAEAGWLGASGRYAAGVSEFDGRRYGYGSADGSLVWMGGHLFAARDISDAFAVVSTEGVAHVPVKLENRVIGTTDEGGMLLVAPLRAWQRNQIAIDPMDLPANVRIDAVERIATPRDRSGIAVRFGIRAVRAAVIVLHDDAGQPLPAGSRVRIAGQDAEAVVGYDGETYIDTLERRTRLEVLAPQGGCEVEVDYPAAADNIPRIGPLTCLTEASP